MSWLVDSDYKTQIRSNVSSMVTDADAQIKALAEAAALEEIRGYLNFDYDVDKILGHRVFDHNVTATYKKHNLAIDSSLQKYVALQDVPADTALTDEDYWLKDIEEFGFPFIANMTFEKGISILGTSSETYLVLQDADSDDNPLTDTDYYYLRRNNLLVMLAVDISLYHQHSRIHAKQVPQYRIDRYLDAIEKLKAIRKRQMNPALPLRATIPTQATGNITIHSTKKRKNDWYS